MTGEINHQLQRTRMAQRFSLIQYNHVEQVVPDCHQVTVQNKDPIKIGVWNVRTLYQCGKIENVIKR